MSVIRNVIALDFTIRPWTPSFDLLVGSCWFSGGAEMSRPKDRLHELARSHRTRVPRSIGLRLSVACSISTVYQVMVLTQNLSQVTCYYATQPFGSNLRVADAIQQWWDFAPPLAKQCHTHARRLHSTLASQIMRVDWVGIYIYESMLPLWPLCISFVPTFWPYIVCRTVGHIIYEIQARSPPHSHQFNVCMSVRLVLSDLW